MLAAAARTQASRRAAHSARRGMWSSRPDKYIDKLRTNENAASMHMEWVPNEKGVRMAKWQMGRYEIPRATEEEVRAVMERQGDSDIEAHPWHIHASVLIERMPVCTPPPPAFEMHHRERLAEMTNPLGLAPIPVKDIMETVPLHKRQELEYLAFLENSDAFNGNKGWRITPADHIGDMGVSKRMLHRRLYLLHRAPTTGEWTLPMGPRRPNETLRNLGDRLVRNHFSKRIVCHMLGNAPLGVTHRRFKQEKDGKQGVQLFHMKAYFKGGAIKHNPKLVDEHIWCTREELQERLDPKLFAEIDHLVFE
ncbi:MAG: hypothetical protein MHM6MM_003761 [Cercozoa sp. M6MM]